jgi:hypothetical protein
VSFEVFPLAEKIEVLEYLLNALAAANVHYLRHFPHTPALYASGVRYLQEPDGRDEWQDIPDTIERRSGDCEDLAAWRMAEIRVREGDRLSRWHITVDELRDTRGHPVTTYHIQIRRPNGQIEDPSRRLGMP